MLTLKGSKLSLAERSRKGTPQGRDLRYALTGERNIITGRFESFTYPQSWNHHLQEQAVACVSG